MAYLAAINRHDWRLVWQLGGKNLGSSYATLIAGFRGTRRDVLQSFGRHGDLVTVHIAAHEADGVVQEFAMNYVVRGGVIISGHGTLLSSSDGNK